MDSLPLNCFFTKIKLLFVCQYTVGLGVEPVMTYHQMMNKHIDELSMAVYLSALKNAYHITPPNTVCAYGSGLEQAIINKPGTFFVDGKYGSAIQGQVHVTIEGVAVTSELVPGHSNLFKVTYLPSEVRNITIHVRWGHIDIPNSPWNLHVVDPEVCKVIGLKETTCMAIQRVFKFRITKVYSTKILRVMVRRFDGAPQECDYHLQENGDVVVSHKANYSEPKTVDVKVAGVHVHESPYTAYCVDPEVCDVVQHNPPPGNPVLFGTTVTFKCTSQDRYSLRGISLNALGPSGTKEIQFSFKQGDAYFDQTEYTPEEIGRHIISFHCAGVPIQGSPIKIDFILPANCKLTSPPRIIYINTYKSLKLTVFNAGFADVQVTSSEMKYLRPEIIQTEEEEYNIVLHGEEIGLSKVSVLYGSYPLNPNPFPVWVVDFCFPFGDAVRPGQYFNLGTLIEFYIDIHRCGPFQLTVNAIGPNKKPFDISVSDAQPNWEGTEMNVHILQFTPPQINMHSLDCFWDGTPIPDSPFLFYIVDPSKCVYHHIPKDNIIFKDTLYKFQIDTNPAGVGARMQVFVLHEPDDASITHRSEELILEKEENGILYYTLVANYLGWLTFWTQYNYTDCRPSPTKYRVEAGAPRKEYSHKLFQRDLVSYPTNCIAYGEALKPEKIFNAREPIEFYVDIYSAGHGYLSSTAQDPANDDFPVELSNLHCTDEESFHTVVLVPFIIDTHYVDVFWNMVYSEQKRVEEIKGQTVTITEVSPIITAKDDMVNNLWRKVPIHNSPFAFKVVDPPKCQFRGLPKETYVLYNQSYIFQVDTNPAGLGAVLNIKETQKGLKEIQEISSTCIGQGTETGVFGFTFTTLFPGWLTMQPLYNYTDILPRLLEWDIVDPKMYNAVHPPDYQNMLEACEVEITNVLIHGKYLKTQGFFGDEMEEQPCIPIIAEDTVVHSGFIPHRIGYHDVSVTCVGFHINYSPFSVPVCYAPWCVIEGLPETTYVIVEHKYTFTVDTNPAFPGAELEIEVRHSEEADPRILLGKETLSGVFKFEFLPHRPAGYIYLTFLYNKRPCCDTIQYDLVDPQQYQAIPPLGIERLRYGVIFDVLNVTIHEKYISSETTHELDKPDVELYLHNNIFTNSFAPRFVGYYHTEVKCVGIHVPGSPFLVPVCDPESCYIDGRFPLYIKIKADTSVSIFTKEAGPGDLTVHFESSEGPGALKIDIGEQNEKGCEPINFYANVICDNVITLRWANYLICRSPLEMRAINPDKLIWSCAKMKHNHILLDHASVFHLNCLEVGNCYPTIDAFTRRQTEDDIHYLVIMEEVAYREFDVTLTPTLLGKMYFNITFAGFATPDLPRDIIIRLYADPMKCYITGRPLKKCFSGVVEEVTVFTPQNGLLEAEALSVTIHPKGRKNNLEDIKVRVEMTDNLDTTYTTKFFIPVQGPYLLNCFVEDEYHCRGSPYKLNAIPGPDALKCILYGKIKDPHPYFVIRKPVQFQVDTTDAGNGVLEMSLKNAYNQSIPVKFTKTKIGKRTVYEGKLFLPEIAEYNLNITWSKYPIPKSPFTIYGSDPLLCTFRELPDPSIPNPDVFAPLIDRPFSFVVDTSKAGKGLVAGSLHYESGDVEQLQVIQESLTLWSITICLKKTGMIELLLFFNEVNILPGTWKCISADPSLYEVLPPKTIMKAHHEVTFELRHVVLGTPYITIHAYREVDEVIEGRVNCREANSTGVFIPRDIGEYHVLVNCGGIAIKGAPFNIQVCDPDAIVHGLVPDVIICGEQCNIKIDCMKAGPGAFSYSYEQLLGDNGKALGVLVQPEYNWWAPAIPDMVSQKTKELVARREKDEVVAEGEEWGNDIYDVKITAIHFGSVKLIFKWADYPIPRLPTKLNVYDPANCMMSIPRDDIKIKPKREFTFFVDTYLSGCIQAEVRALILEQDCNIKCEQIEKQTKVVFTADFPGDYVIEVRCYRVHVKGSPFTIKVTDEDLIEVFGSVPPLMPIGGMAQITVDCIEAGAGPMQSHCSAKRGLKEPLNISIVSLAEHLDRYEVTFNAVHPGIGTLMLTWGGRLVPGFPQPVTVVDLSCCKTVLYRPSRGYYVAGEMLSIVVSQLINKLPVDVTIYSPTFETHTQLLPDENGNCVIEYQLALSGSHRVEASAFNILLNGFPIDVDVLDSTDSKNVLPVVQKEDGLHMLSDKKEVSIRDVRRSLVLYHADKEQSMITEVAAAAQEEPNKRTLSKFSRLSRRTSTNSEILVNLAPGFTVAVDDVIFKKRRRSSLSITEKFLMTEHSRALKVTVTEEKSRKRHPFIHGENKVFGLEQKTYIEKKLRQVISGHSNALEINLQIEGLMIQDKLRVMVLDKYTGQQMPVTITDRGKGSYLIEFCVTQVHHFQFVITYEDVHIMGSPITFNCAPDIDILQLVATGNIVEYTEGVSVNEKEMILRVDTTVCGPGHLNAVAKDDIGSPVPFAITEEDDEENEKHYTLLHVDINQMGIYILELYYRDIIPIPGSPFKLNIVDSSCVEVSGLPPESSLCINDNITFVIDTRNAGMVVPEVLLCDPNGEFFPIEPFNEQGTAITYRYYPIKSGNYSIYIECLGQSVAGSPFGFTVSNFESTGLTIHEETLKQYKGTFHLGQVAYFEFSGVPLNVQGICSQAHGPTTDIPVSVQFVPGAIWTASFMPSEAGLYHVFVECEGYQIEGSPFVIGIADSKKCYIIGEAPGVIHVGLETVVMVKTKGAGVGNISVKIDDVSSSDLISYRVLDIGLHTYAIVLKGKNVGHSTVELHWAGKRIEACSFEVLILDASKCVVKGNVIRSKRADLAEVSSVTVNVAGAGDSTDLEFVLEGPSGECEVIVNLQENGLYVGRFTPWETGPHSLEIKWGGVRIGRGQYLFMVEYIEDRDMNDCYVAGPGLRQIKAQRETQLVLLTGEVGLINHKNLSVSLKGVSHQIPVKIEDTKIGTYIVTYTVPTVGAYLMSIKYYKKHVQGSPFKVTSLPPPDPSQVHAYGSSLSENVYYIAGDPIEIFIDVSRGGDGKVIAHVTGPDSQQVPVYVNKVSGEAKKYSIIFNPLSTGKFTLSVLWDNQHIPQSPFRFRILPAPNASKVVVQGPGLSDDVVGCEGVFTIDTLAAGVGKVSVRVHGWRDSFQIKIRPVNPPDTRLLKATYTPTKPGQYVLFVRFSGEHVPGSPFKVNISKCEGDNSDAEDITTQGWEKWGFEDDDRLVVVRAEHKPVKGKPVGYYLNETRKEDIARIIQMKSTARAVSEGKSDKSKKKYSSTAVHRKSEIDDPFILSYKEADLVAHEQISLASDVSQPSYNALSDSSMEFHNSADQRKKHKTKRKHSSPEAPLLTLTPAKVADLSFGEVKESQDPLVQAFSPNKKGIIRKVCIQYSGN